MKKLKECIITKTNICVHEEIKSGDCTYCKKIDKKCDCDVPLIYSALAVRCLRCGYLVR